MIALPPINVRLPSQTPLSRFLLKSQQALIKLMVTLAEMRLTGSKLTDCQASEGFCLTTFYILEIYRVVLGRVLI